MWTGRTSKKFDRILMEMERRGHNLKKRQPIQRGYFVDALIGNVAILKTPVFSIPVNASKNAFNRRIEMLKNLGFRILIVPNSRMSQDQVKAFCDYVEEALVLNK